ncbi:MAG: iron-sulfur cluster assembly protein, partial [Propionibacterium sp.]|nr:iron-sulfur cluster assembly protein [Propionibacterium sp.]
MPAVTEALSHVQDPEIKQPLLDLGMVESLNISEDGVVDLKILLTVSGCPMKDTLRTDSTKALNGVPG